MLTLNTELLEIRKNLFALVLILFQAFMVFAINYSFYSEGMLYNSYGETLSHERITALFEQHKKYNWLGFLLIPLLFYIKVLYNTCVLTTGSLLSHSRAGFTQNFNVCLKAEYVFILMLFAKFVALGFFKEVNRLSDLSFVPGSLASLYNTDELPGWAIYPLQTLNIWEVLFVWTGCTLYALQFGVTKTMAFKRFCIPYLTGLLIWLLLVAFVTIQFS